MDDRRRELEGRVYGSDTPDPRDVAELHRLMSGAAGPATGAQDPAVPPAESADEPLASPPDPPGSPGPGQRPARAWLAGGAVAVLAAGLIGAGLTQAALRGDGEDNPRAEVTSAAQAASPGGAASRSLGDEYFDQDQTAGDIPDVTLPRIDASTTRRVLAQWGQTDGEAGIWVARGTDRSYCLVMSVGSARGASSCTPRAAAATTGVRLDLVTAGGASISARWNITAGILEISPFPAEQKSMEATDRATTDAPLDPSAGAIVLRSGSATPKP